MSQARRDLSELVAFRSIASPDLEPASECRDAARWLVRTLTAAGLEEAQTYEAGDGSECVLARASRSVDAPTVLLYSHYDVQPPLASALWETPPWELTDRSDGRWYGRGAADCKGNVIVHLTALRALQALYGRVPLNVIVVVDGSEEQGSAGLAALVRSHPHVLRADIICVADAGSVAVGQPTLTTSLRGIVCVDLTLAGLHTPAHSGKFGGPAPDALAGMMKVLASLHDKAGNTTIDGLDRRAEWSQAAYTPGTFRADAQVLDDVELIGQGTLEDLLWARPSVTVVGLDVPTVAESSLAIPATVRARIALRVPTGVSATDAEQAIVAHLRARVPWKLNSLITVAARGEPFSWPTGGAAADAFKASLELAYERAPVLVGGGGSIPICNVLKEAFPDSEMLLYGVQDPSCHSHGPNESVVPGEIERLGVAEALFLQTIALTDSGL